MYRQKCGRQLKEGSRFCDACGAQQVYDEQSDTAVSENMAGKKGLIIAIVAVGIIVIILAAAVVILAREKMKVQDTFHNTDMMDIDAAQTSEENETFEMLSSEDVDEQYEKPEMMQDDSFHEEQTEISQRGDDTWHILAAVPTESMSLRSAPGYGEDVIAEIVTGTYLLWDGEQVTENDRDFYRVTVQETQQTGYVSADYCVAIDFEYQENDLNVVEKDNALYTYEMMVYDLESLCSMYSDRLSCRILGESLDGRNIYEVVLGNPDAENHVMMQASIHAREYMNTQLVMRLIEYYALYYDTGTYHGISYRDLFEKTALHIVPMANPDGVTISQLGTDALNDSQYADLVYECYERDKPFLAYRQDAMGDMTWMDFYDKEGYDREAEGDYREITYDEYTKIWKANARGVDLNVNFDAAWQDIDLKEQESYEHFKGYGPVSEPETQILAEMAQRQNYACYISYHSKGNIIYFDVAGNKPETSELSENFAMLMESHIHYKRVNTNKGYNINLGGFGDWIQLGLNKASVTIESGRYPCPLEAHEFPAVWLRHRESWAMLAESMY